MSSDGSSLTVAGLGKRYRVSGPRLATNSLREALVDLVKAPLRQLRELRADAATAEETFWALRDISFAVAPGEVLGVVGKNGAGKSTLLKLLSRITEPTEGRITLHGRVASLLEVGTGFHPELSGRENIYLNGTILGMRKREVDQKLDEIVAFAEVERFLDTPVKRYSSGMYVRLAFAVAAHLEPEILLVDEVLAVGDADFQAKCLGKMGEVARHGRTILFVSHNMAAVQRLCTRAILLERGRLTLDADPRSVTQRYLGGEERPRFEATARTGKAQLIAAQLLSAAGEPIERPLSTEPFVIELDYAFPTAAPGTRLGIGFLSADGVPLFTSNVRDVGLELPPKPGEYRARVTVPGGVLLAGQYHLAVCLWNPREVLDLQEPALSLTVDAGPSILYIDGPDRKGFVHLPLEWQLES
jgi:lipopolysaccharide transport system ATP-binding protein